MNANTRSPLPAGFSRDSALPPFVLLALGSLFIFFSFMRFSIGELGWVTFAPLLAYLHQRGSLKQHLVLLATLVIAYILTVSKMATSEIPWAVVPMFATPLALSSFVTLSITALAHRRLGARWGAYTFAAMSVVMAWVQYTFTPGSSWGILAHTQLDNLPLIQLAVLTGTGGITFLVALGSGLAAAAWTSGMKTVRMDMAVLVVLVAGAIVYGQLRLAGPAPGEMIRVGSVVTPVTHKDFPAAMKDVNTLRVYDDELFARSARAAELGARAVVWNEMATLTSVPGEAALAERGQAFAQAHSVLMMMAYGVVDSVQPFHYINKYRIYLPNGTLADEYRKRHPVPGDPETPATAHAKVISFDGVKLTGAICYDYGFPGIARDNANDGAGLALVPSSDWRGIDPGHGRMAMINAVAAGVAMVRPVRAATSIAVDQYGRLLASMRADDANRGVMVVNVPGARVPTLYAKTGEIVPLAALAFCVFVIVMSLRKCVS